MIYSIYAPNESSPDKKISTRAAQKSGGKRGPFASFFHHGKRTKPRVILVENKHPSRTAIVNVRGFQHDGMLKSSASSSRKTSSIGEDPRDQLVTIKPKTKRYITVQKEQVYLYILFKKGDDEEFYFAPSPERPLDTCSEFYVIEEEDLEPSNAEKISFAFYQGQVHLDRLIVSA